jgi:hypothetical protein
MPSWSGRLFFFGMVAFLIYVIMIGDAPKWKALFTQRGASTTTTVGQATSIGSVIPGQVGATGAW